MDSDLISRAEAIEIVRSLQVTLGGKEILHPEAKKSVLNALDDIPAVDAEPVRHGRWEHGMRCTQCGQIDLSKPNYCPNCGAKMEGEVQNEQS